MEIIGRQLECAIGAEETRGTISSELKWVKNISANVVERAEHAQDESTRGVFEDEDGRRVVKKHIEGDIEMPVYANAFGLLAYNLYGGVVSTLVTGSIYSHVFNLEQSALAPSLTIIGKDGAVQQIAYKNCHINTLELTANPDDYVKVTASFIGKEGADDTTESSYVADYDFIGKDITVKMADSSAGLVDATPLCVKELSISFDKGLIADHCLGAYEPSDIYMSKMAIEGSININFETEAIKDLYLGDNAKYMEIKIEGATDLGSGNKPTITLLLNKVQIQDWNRDGGKDDLVVEDISFKAYYNATDSKQSQMTIKNTTASYEPVVSI